MRTVGIVLVVITLLLVPSSGMRAQSATGAPQAIEDLMSAKEFEAAGLRKLSMDELRALNTWLGMYTRAVVQTAAHGPAIASKVSATPDLIESQIDGEFQGWAGETVFKLLNGQIWQQSSYAYVYHYAYSPKVLIYKSGAGYKMKVDGVNSEIAVRRLK